MASSSSPAPSSQYPQPYDIFLSFRGEDVRGGFVSHLYAALGISEKTETFIDRKLPKGTELWPSLKKAIKDSTMSLVIFSENYASSKWCLKELTKILDCSKNQGHLVVPVFYRVDPSHVRKQSGSYQKAFEDLKRNGISEQRLQKWKKSLTDAANLDGFHISNRDDEADRIKEIVRIVTEMLSELHPSEDNPEGLIGIEERMKDVELLLDKESNDVRIICIWGMGGLGKTTLARALYNKWCSEYKGSHHFVEKVGEKSKNHGIQAVKSDLIKALLGDNNSHTSSYDMRRLRRKEVFIVFDDVNDYDQVYNLVGRRDWFRPGSKILITTRDSGVLGTKVDRDAIYELKGLDSKEAFQLFSSHAFGKDRPAPDPKLGGLATKLTRYANGNPLALRVLGSSLANAEDPETWESRLEKLQKVAEPDINKVLKISLDELDNEVRESFLDIACLVTHGDNVGTVKDLLKARRGYSVCCELKRLKEKALVEVAFGSVFMHDLLREMGRQAVRDESPKHPRKRSRLWDPKEISEILGAKKIRESEAIVEGVSLNLREVGEMRLSPGAFRSMPNLKALNIYSCGKIDGGDGLDFLPEGLTSLRWMAYPFESLPATFKAVSLVQLEMPLSSLTRLWDGVQNLVNLSKITLRQSMGLIELPDFSKATRLEHVDLEWCSKLRSVHPSILSLPNLRRLSLRCCLALTSLTSDTHLQSLIELDVHGCSRLKEFSVTSEKEELDLQLSGTAISGALRSSSGHRSKIRSLALAECRIVTSVHELIELRDLQVLDAGGCNKLASPLLSKCDKMGALRILSLAYCNELSELPNNISLLSSLRQLHLSETHVETLPSSIKHLSRLQRLELNRCKRLRRLPELPPSILTLTATDCTSLETIESLETIQYSPSTNEGEKGKYKPYPGFLFTNCKKLSRRTIKAAEARVLLEVKKATYDHAGLEYPGESVPKWFMYRDEGSSVSVNLSSIPNYEDGVFLFCAFFNKLPFWLGGNIDAKWFIDGEYACRAAKRSCGLGGVGSSTHVGLWYDPDSLGELKRKIEERKRNGQSNTELEVKFEGSREVEIKRCGIDWHYSHNLILLNLEEFQQLDSTERFSPIPFFNSLLPNGL
ncbi:disease resistance-like protein DSC1 [Neltuma alba]|uniref:disease resistance-like protein DSC1 n=1 Tax=Neltuma alba TaxID=207710 RepID=UPI0010A36504|nr:disease resistance-like protein DSC1 [Prosopis alba]